MALIISMSPDEHEAMCRYIENMTAQDKKWDRFVNYLNYEYIA